MADLIDLSVDEVKAVTALQNKIQSQYMWRTNNLKTAFDLRDRLRDGMAQLGFEVDITPPTGTGNYIPVCTIKGRTDKHLQAIMNEQGADIERKAWDLKRESQDELKAQGVNTDIL